MHRRKTLQDAFAPRTTTAAGRGHAVFVVIKGPHTQKSLDRNIFDLFGLYFYDIHIAYGGQKRVVAG